MARSERGLEQAFWYGRLVRLVNLTGHLEPADDLYKVIEADIGACTRAYVAKDKPLWTAHLLRIRLRLEQQRGPLECHPTWC